MVILFSLSRLRANSEVREMLINDMLSTDDATLVIYSEQLQQLRDIYTKACQEFRLDISLKKDQRDGPMRWTASRLQSQQIRHGDGPGIQRPHFGHLLLRHWDQQMNRMSFHHVCQALPQESERTERLLQTPKLQSSASCCTSVTWRLYFRYERRLSVFHLRCLSINWSNQVNKDVLTCTQLTSLYANLPTAPGPLSWTRRPYDECEDSEDPSVQETCYRQEWPSLCVFKTDIRGKALYVDG